MYMNTDFSDLSIMQMSDSFFPTGLYTMSNGLETLFDEKQIQTVDQIEELITTIISVSYTHLTLPTKA